MDAKKTDDHDFSFFLRVLAQSSRDGSASSNSAQENAVLDAVCFFYVTKNSYTPVNFSLFLQMILLFLVSKKALVKLPKKSNMELGGWIGHIVEKKRTN